MGVLMQTWGADLPKERFEIADEVIEAIAGRAVAETEGVASMTGGPGAEKLGRKSPSKGIKFRSDGARGILDIYIIAKYGAKLDRLFREIQQNVKESVEKTAGISVDEVNVFTQGLSPVADATKTKR